MPPPPQKGGHNGKRTKNRESGPLCGQVCFGEDVGLDMAKGGEAKRWHPGKKAHVQALRCRAPLSFQETVTTVTQQGDE